MSQKNKDCDEVYVVLRWDGFHGVSSSPEVIVTVKEIVRNRDLADAEVARLNALNEEKGARYWWTTTRLFPAGQSAGGVES